MLILLKNVTSFKKLPINLTFWSKSNMQNNKLRISQVESFLNSNFLPKSNMKNSIYTKPLNLKLYHNCLALYFCWSSEKYFGVIKNVEKAGVGKRLNWDRAKKVFAKTISDLIFATKWNNWVKLDKRRKFWYLLLRVFLIDTMKV